MQWVHLTTMAAVMVAIACSASHGAHYFLSPGGDDGNAGSRDAPWQRLQKAAEAAQPGDTVVLLPGSYAGELRPINSGTADAPIIFRAQPRLEATLTGPDGGIPIVLENLEYIRVEGLHVVPDDPGVGWMVIRNSSHVTVEDCRMENSTFGLAAHIDSCEDVHVRNSVFQKQLGGINMFRISNVTRLLFEGNTISRAGHSPLQFYPDHSNTKVVMRGNVFHAAWGRSFEHFGTQHCLFEHNIITHAFDSGWAGSANAKFATTRSIFRFNRVFRNVHGTHGVQRQKNLTGGTPEQVRLISNVFTGLVPGQPVIRDYDDQLTVEALQSEAVRAQRGARYVDNMDVDPGYLDPENYNHALREDSPLRNAGAFLTVARGAGEGTLLPVEDANFFYDGYGIEG